MFADRSEEYYDPLDDPFYDISSHLDEGCAKLLDSFGRIVAKWDDKQYAKAR
jgi:hypothetical protein